MSAQANARQDTKAVQHAKAVPQAKPSPQAKAKQAAQRNERLLSLAIFLGLMLVWEAAGRMGYVNTFFFSWPSAIGVQCWKLLVSGALWTNLLVTAYAYCIGVFVAVIAGSILGLAMGWWKTFGSIVDPYVVFFSAMPRIALYPLLLMIFGINDLSRIVIVIIGVIFPVVFNAYMGAKQTPRLLIDAANVFGYSSNQLFLHVIFPASLPYLIAGVRTGVTLGMIMVVVAEFFGGSSGLGQNIAQTAQLYKTAELYAWVLYTSLFALVLVKGADLFERWAMRWA